MGSVFGPCFLMQYLVSVLSSFAIILMEKRELVALLNCLPIMFVTVTACVSSSWCGGLICTM